MPDAAPSALDSNALATRLRELAGEEREIQVEFLLHLDEFDRRRAYLELGYGSLWTYCLEALHLREGPAGRRIQAMRVLRRFPALEGALRDGRLCLTTIALLGPVLTDENLGDLLARAAYRTRAEVDHLVASLQPRTAPRDGIRKLPDPAPANAIPFPLQSHGPQRSAASTGALALPPALGFAAADADLRRNDAPTPRRARPVELQAVSASEWSLRVTIDASLKEDLESLRSLLSHKIPDGDLRAVLREAVRCAIEKHGKRMGTVAPSRACKQAKALDADRVPEEAQATQASVGARRLGERSCPTTATRREVVARDGASCSFSRARCGRPRWRHAAARASGARSAARREPTPLRRPLHC